MVVSRWKIADGQSLSFGAQYYNDEQDSDYGPDLWSKFKCVMFNADPTYSSIAAVKACNLRHNHKLNVIAFNTQYENQDVFRPYF